MRRLKIFPALALLVVLCSGLAHAAETTPTKSSAPPPQEMAVFSVPGLMEGTLLKDLAKALSTQPGVVAAQVDTPKGTFNVTFEPRKISPDDLLKTVASIAKDAKLVSVVPATAKPVGDGCGKCPSAKSCPGAKK